MANVKIHLRTRRGKCKYLKMLSHETVHRNRIKLVSTEKALNSQKCLTALYIVSWVIIQSSMLYYEMSVFSVTTFLNFQAYLSLVKNKPVFADCAT